MKILAWNLNHKASERRLKTGVAEAVCKLDPDVLILTEYVHGVSRLPLLEALRQGGIDHIRFSDRLNLNNQVLIASRLPMELGDMRGPDMPDFGGTCNFLHVKVSGIDLEVVGLRAPAYETSGDLREYWTQLVSTVRGAKGRSVVFAGDLNADPRTAKRTGDKHLAALCAEGWQIPDAVGKWSYSSGTRVDHAILSPRFAPARAHCVTAVDDLVLAGRGVPAAISDHAALLVEFDVPNEREVSVPDVALAPLPPVQLVAPR